MNEIAIIHKGTDRPEDAITSAVKRNRLVRSTKPQTSQLVLARNMDTTMNAVDAFVDGGRPLRDIALDRLCRSRQPEFDRRGNAESHGKRPPRGLQS